MTLASSAAASSYKLTLLRAPSNLRAPGQWCQSGGMSVTETLPIPNEGARDTAVRTFLIADVRGYTRFTLEHGDEAAARLASAFAQLAGEVVSASGGEVIELRG